MLLFINRKHINGKSDKDSMINVTKNNKTIHNLKIYEQKNNDL